MERTPKWLNPPFDALAPHVAEALRRLADVAREGADQLGGGPADVPAETSEAPEPVRPERTRPKVVAADPAVSALAARIGHEFADPGLLIEALTHRSWCAEHDGSPSNERLEFLGDAAVNLVISEALYNRHPDDDEGNLSARRAAIVSTVGLARLAGRIDLGRFLLLGEGEAQRSGRRRPSLLASAFEALTGALYLDLGLEAVRDWLVGVAGPELAAEAPIVSLKSPKSRLQEFTQRRSGDRPTYRLLAATGPDHEKSFRIEVWVDGTLLGVGEGPSRRIAETAAASQALETLRTMDGGEVVPGAAAEVEAR